MMRKHFLGAAWQRGQTHFSRNILDKCPKKYQPEVKKNLNRIYHTKDLEAARSMLRETLQIFEVDAPKVMAILEAGGDESTGKVSSKTSHIKWAGTAE